MASVSADRPSPAAHGWARHPMDQSEPVRLLLVDDEAALREPLADYLSRQGFVVRQAASAAEAPAITKTSSRPGRRVRRPGWNRAWVAVVCMCAWCAFANKK